MEIAREAYRPPDLSIDPDRFAPGEHGDHSFQVERFRDVEAELRVLRCAYLREVRPGREHSPDWDRLREANDGGRSVIFTARHISNVLDGVCWLWLSEDLDSKLKVASDDLLYVKPRERNGLLGVRLVQYAERCIFDLGVREARMHFRLANGAQRMARFLGYSPQSVRVTKTHHGDNFADVPTRHEGVQ